MVFGCGSRIVGITPRRWGMLAPGEARFGPLQVEAHLQIEPELRRGPEVARKAKRGVGRDATRAAHDLVDTPRRSDAALSSTRLCGACASSGAPVRCDLPAPGSAFPGEFHWHAPCERSGAMHRGHVY